MIHAAHHRNIILVFSRTISTFSRTPDLHPDHAQSLLGSTQIKLTTLATSNMASCWNRSSTSCLFTDQRPLPQPHPKPSDLNSNAIMHLHRPREQSHLLLTFSFNLPKRTEPKVICLDGFFMSGFHALTSVSPYHEQANQGRCHERTVFFFVTGHPRSLRRYSPSPFDKLQHFLIQRVPRNLFHQSRKQTSVYPVFFYPANKLNQNPSDLIFSACLFRFWLGTFYHGTNDQGWRRHIFSLPPRTATPFSTLKTAASSSKRALGSDTTSVGNGSRAPQRARWNFGEGDEFGDSEGDDEMLRCGLASSARGMARGMARPLPPA
ncbi:hypothetical protein LXL04_010959 [Taraxacum kok-saghyz]